MKPVHTEADFSHSLTDLMSGLAVMFLVIAAIFMVQSAKATQADRRNAETKRQLAEKHKRDADDLKQLRERNDQSIRKLIELKAALEENPQLQQRIQLEYAPAVDPLLLTISFTNEQLQFDPNECEVSSLRERELDDTLGELFPELCRAILSDTTVTQSITLEGHTDVTRPWGSRCGMTASARCISSPRDPACVDEAFENNVRLSARRAQYVFFRARAVLRATSDAQCLDEYSVISGRGQMNPATPGQVSDQDRRVEIKVRVMAARPE